MLTGLTLYKTYLQDYGIWYQVFLIYTAHNNLLMSLYNWHCGQGHPAVSHHVVRRSHFLPDQLLNWCSIPIFATTFSLPPTTHTHIHSGQIEVQRLGTFQQSTHFVFGLGLSPVGTPQHRGELVKDRRAIHSAAQPL